MEMEVVVPVAAPSADFNFDSNCSSPYMTAPSSPQRFGNFFFSAPTSPTRVSAFFHQLNDMATHSSVSSSSVSSSSASSVPFRWEQKPGVPKPKPESTTTHDDINEENDDFEFNFSGNLERASLSAADELFDGGKIRPLKPPPRLHSGDGFSPPASNASSPRSSSRISQGKKMVQEAFSPRHQKKKDFDPFATAMEETRKREQQQKRGRERVLSSSTTSSSSGSGRRGSRSLSPLRVSDIIVCDSVSEDISQTGGSGSGKGVSSSASSPKSSSATSSYASFLSSISFAKGYRKWRLKDFLLFRSASEGRATDKDPLMRKYAVLSRRASSAAEEDVRNSSFRSAESSSGSISRRRGPVSAHELHYTVNRAASEEMKKKTFLPYKQGLLGCLGFNPGMHEITRGIGSLTRS